MSVTSYTSYSKFKLVLRSALKMYGWERVQWHYDSPTRSYVLKISATAKSPAKKEEA